MTSVARDRHNHRWTYTSRILSGSYTHNLYGPDHDFTDQVDVSALTPRMARVEEPGDTYTLHHSMIHSVTTHGETVTLIVRGPAVKDRFVVTDRPTGQAWWQYGADKETREVAATKRMNDNQHRDPALLPSLPAPNWILGANGAHKEITFALSWMCCPPLPDRRLPGPSSQGGLHQLIKTPGEGRTEVAMLTRRSATNQARNTTQPLLQ